MDTKEAGKLGGIAAAKNMTKEQRKERATKAVRARELKRSQTTPTKETV